MQVLFSAYRRDDFADAEGFVAQLGTILSEFDQDVVMHVTSPQTGLQRRMKWPPSIAEVIEACEAHRDRLARMREPRRVPLRLPPPSLRGPGSLANCFVPSAQPRYAALIEWTRSAEPRLFRFDPEKGGLWVNLDIWTQHRERK